jgi:hypothetical protein
MAVAAVGSSWFTGAGATRVGAAAGSASANGTDFAANRTFCSSRARLMRAGASTTAAGIFSSVPLVFPSPD